MKIDRFQFPVVLFERTSRGAGSKASDDSSRHSRRLNWSRMKLYVQFIVGSNANCSTGCKLVRLDAPGCANAWRPMAGLREDTG